MPGEQVHESSCLSMFKPIFKICFIFQFFALYNFNFVNCNVDCLVFDNFLATCVYSECVV